MISEINSAKVGGDKDAWLADMNASIAKYPEIKAVIWFETYAENYFEIDTKPESYIAF